MKKIKLFLSATILLAFPSTSYSQLYIEETFFPVYVKRNDSQISEVGGSTDQAVATESGVGYDFRTTIGYTFTNNIILGLTYNLFSVSSSRPSVGVQEAIERALSKNEMGPTIGYSLGAWRFLLTYFLTAEKSLKNKVTTSAGSVDTDETTTNLSGKGIQATVNYSLNLGSGFEIGPSLIYRSLTYPKQTLESRAGASTPYTNTTLVTPAIDAELKPMITVVYRY